METAFWIAVLVFFLWFIFRNKSTVPRPSSPGSGTHPIPKTETWMLGPGEVFKKEYVSFTRIRAFEKCPRMFELIYLYGFQDRPGRAAQVGSLVHEMIHLDSLEHQGSLSERLRDHGAVEALLDLYDQAVSSINPTYPIPEVELRPYLENFVVLNTSDSFRIRATEQQRSCIIGGFNLKCVIDRVDVRPQSAPTLIDYKTGNPQRAVNRQLETYAYVLNEGKWTPSKLVFQFLKNASVRDWQYTRRLHDKAEQWLLQRIDEVQNTKVSVGKSRNCVITAAFRSTVTGFHRYRSEEQRLQAAGRQQSI